MAQQPFNRRSSWHVRRPGWWTTFVAVWVAAVAWTPSAQQQRSPAPATPAASAQAAAAAPVDNQALIKTYCVSCHNERTKTAGLALDATDLNDIPAHADVWEKVVRKVRAGMMPPPGMPRPDDAVRRAMVTSLTGTLDRAARATPNPGRPLVHRLNRAEYANSIRDLLDLDVDVSAMLPPDDSSGGFDNNADVLGVSPVLLESYLTAAERVSALAIGDMRTRPVGELFRIRQDASQDRHVEGMPLGTVGGMMIHRTLPLDGEYQFQVRLFRTNLGTMRGLEYPHQLEIAVDGVRVHLASFGGNKEIAASSENPTTTGDDIDARFTVRVPLKAGPHDISIAFLEKTHGLNTRRLQNYIRSSSDTIDFSGYPHIDQIQLTGPFQPTGPGDTPSRRRIFVCRPTSAADEEACARRVLSPLVRRAYRGDVTPQDMTTVMQFYTRGRQEGGSFDTGIDLGLRRTLSSPKFIFRAERDPANVAAGTAYELGDLELASRLSFFLWSTIPDDTLLDLAAKGRLRAPGMLEQQVRRMVLDPKSQAFADNFMGQWLQLRNIRTSSPTRTSFPTSTTTCGARSRPRPRCSCRPSSARIAASLT